MTIFSTPVGLFLFFFFFLSYQPLLHNFHVFFYFCNRFKDASFQVIFNRLSYIFKISWSKNATIHCLCWPFLTEINFPMSPVSSTVSSIQGHGFLTWRRVPPNPQLGSAPLLPVIICFRVLEDTLDSRHMAVAQPLNCVRLLKTPRPVAGQEDRLLCPPFPRVCSNSCPLSPWLCLMISSSLVPFSSCPHSFPASGSFPLSWLFASGGQSIGASASASSVLPMNILGWFPWDWLVWSPYSPRDSQETSPAPDPFFCSFLDSRFSHYSGHSISYQLYVRFWLEIISHRNTASSIKETAFLLSFW